MRAAYRVLRRHGRTPTGLPSAALSELAGCVVARSVETPALASSGVVSIGEGSDHALEPDWVVVDHELPGRQDPAPVLRLDAYHARVM